MKLTSLSRLAAVSAVALGAALYSGYSQAANEIGTAQLITVGGTLENDLTVAAVAGDIKFSATGGGTDRATGVINPDGTIASQGPGTGLGVGSAHPASLVFDPIAVQKAPSIDITSTFVGATMFVGVDSTAGSVTDLTCGGAINITHITDNEASDFAGTALVWDKPAAAAATGSPGKHVIGGGVETIKFGLSLTTATGATAGAYNAACAGGTFKILIDY